MESSFWQFESGDSPILAVASHDGHALREELQGNCALSEEERLREEDPFTGRWTSVAPTRMIALHSRFEVDLNRPRDKAVYLAPEDAWGLRVWKVPLNGDVLQRSLERYDSFYRNLGAVLQNLLTRHDRVVVYDLHSYNHRRQGPDGPPASHAENPEVNVGTGTMDRARWGAVVDRFIGDLRGYDYFGRSLDVRENVRFFGGNLPRWIHASFPESVCVLAVEFKKFFMDEWTGEPDPAQLEAIESALHSTIGGVLEVLHDPACEGP